MLHIYCTIIERNITSDALFYRFMLNSCFHQTVWTGSSLDNMSIISYQHAFSRPFRFKPQFRTRAIHFCEKFRVFSHFIVIPANNAIYTRMFKIHLKNQRNNWIDKYIEKADLESLFEFFAKKLTVFDEIFRLWVSYEAYNCCKII